MKEQPNLFLRPESDAGKELFETILERPGIKIERIVSTGQQTPAGEWYDQAWDEWVLLLAGAATLQIEGELAPRRLLPGDSIMLPAHCRHRVEWTAPAEQSIWLALHFTG